MVSVTHTAPTAPAGALPDLSRWLDAVAEGRTPAEAERFARALDAAAAFHGEGGTSRLAHGLNVAAIVAALRLDGDAVCAAALHGVPADKVAEDFGPDVAALVDGVERMGQMGELLAPPEGQSHAPPHLEALRKMLLAMVEDIRVVLVKLAERTQALREAAARGEAERLAVAREVRDVFAPLANRLGVWQLKWEMEDLTFRYLEPETYKAIARLLDERRVDRERYIETVQTALRAELAKAGLRAEVSGRPKHIYSIYKKMQRKGLGFDELYDVRAVRVLVETVADCYAALGVVHNLWVPIPKEFDDYISRPKGNAYQSLHTAVIGPEDKAVEVQIRTFEMHRHAELGVAAHWRYKEGGRRDTSFEEKIAWLRQILEWQDDMPEAGEMVERFKTGLFRDTLYVLTPQGKVVDLPQGATPVDFAYHVHTELGHRCRGAKVDGTIVPLNTPLRNGQRVEILAAKQGGPSRDWLSASLGYVRSSRARAKIRQWFNVQHFEENVARGRDLLEKETHRAGVPTPNLERLAQKQGFDRPDDLLAALGRGELSPRQALAAPPEENREAAPQNAPVRPMDEGGGILVENVGNLLTVFAQCCKPVPPDPIVGFVTRGRGVAIHRADCPNIKRLDPKSQDRLFSARWGKTAGFFAADVEVEAADRQGLLRDVSEAFAREKVNVTATRTLTRGTEARMRFTVQVGGVEQLEKVLAAVREVPGVSRVMRI